MAMARGSIGMHCAWDDTTALIRISEQNEGVSHSGSRASIAQMGTSSGSICKKVANAIWELQFRRSDL